MKSIFSRRGLLVLASVSAVVAATLVAVPTTAHAAVACGVP